MCESVRVTVGGGLLACVSLLCVFQAISAQDEKLAQTMFLPLAERMVEKMVKEEKIEAEAEVQLYFMILERLGKCVEALDVVRGPLGGKSGVCVCVRRTEIVCVLETQREDLCSL